jgi:hypothetical protein
MSASSRRSGTGSTQDETIVVAIVIGVVVAAVAVLTATVHLAIALGDTSQRVPANPLTLTLQLIKGHTA